ncbi:hypothetical protein F4777DRAFT_558657 [Nemania sp. FL0916]|nr:hypothetical protein F4777DRAFT_558657 [Nemania sp. FL0916]
MSSNDGHGPWRVDTTPQFGSGQSKEEVDFETAIDDFQSRIVDWQVEIRDACVQLRRLIAGKIKDKKTIDDLRAKVKELTEKVNTATGVLDGTILAELQGLRDEQAAVQRSRDDANRALAAALAAKPAPAAAPAPVNNLSRSNMIDFGVAMHDDLFGAIERAKYFHTCPKTSQIEYEGASNYMYQELTSQKVTMWQSFSRSSWESI